MVLLVCLLFLLFLLVYISQESSGLLVDQVCYYHSAPLYIIFKHQTVTHKEKISMPKVAHSVCIMCICMCEHHSGN